MQSQERDRIAAYLQSAVPAGASSEAVAALVAKSFLNVDQALVPIVGERGMAALYKRSVHLARPIYPWLPKIADDADAAANAAALAAALSAQTSAQAAAAGAHLLEGLRAVLATLIGESLTERLLRAVWATFLSGPSARDTKT